MPSCVWVRVPSLARLLEIGEYSSVSFFYACGRSSGKRSGPRGFVPLCHCVTSPEGERKRLSPFRSLARFFRDRGVFPGLFFLRLREVFGETLHPSLTKARSRCGRGRHGRPWPCEWDVGREPDRDERSEPPTAAPPPGAIQTPEKCKTIMTIRPAVFRVGTTPRPQS